jgi:formylglycine-generating enzyme required for sulfatase activity
MKLQKYLKLTRALDCLLSLPEVGKWSANKKIQSKLKGIASDENLTAGCNEIASQGLQYLELKRTASVLLALPDIEDWYDDENIEDTLALIENDPNSTQDCVEIASLGQTYLNAACELDKFSSLHDVDEWNNNNFIQKKLLSISRDRLATPDDMYRAALAAVCVLKPLVEVLGGIQLNKSKFTATKIVDFQIGATSVTMGEWQGVRNWAVQNGFDMSDGDADGPEYPIININWYDAVKWCNARSAMEGLEPVYGVKGHDGYYTRGDSGKEGSEEIVLLSNKNGYRLPLDLEWEWAAKGGRNSQGYTYAGSNSLDSVGWYADNSGGEAHPVGEKAPNELGLHDMSGNVFDWCWDLNGSERRIRGGSWYNKQESSAVDYRPSHSPNFSSTNFGFRIARNLSGSSNQVVAEMQLVKIQGGKFGGENWGSGIIEVADFQIGKFAVTLEEWQIVRAWALANKFDIAEGSAEGPKYPVTQVNWHDAVKWCNAKSLMEGLEPVYGIKGEEGFYCRGEVELTNWGQGLGDESGNVVWFNTNGYRLPLEAEWGWAASGRGAHLGPKVYSGSDDLNAVGWFKKNAAGWFGNKGPRQVGEKQPNNLGLYDMSGNVWEWCWNKDLSDMRRCCGGSWESDANWCSMFEHSPEGNPVGDNKGGFKGRCGVTWRDLGHGFRVARSL